MFRIGAEVRLINGWTKMTVVRINDDNSITAVYTSALPMYETCIKYNYRGDLGSKSKTRMSHEFVLWDNTTKEKKMSNVLQNGTKIEINKPYVGHGVYIGLKSNGQHVVETIDCQGNSVVRLHDRDDFDIKPPYVFRVKLLNGTDNTCRHYMCEEGQVQHGDILVSYSGNMYLVDKLDVRGHTAKLDFKGHKLKKEAF